MSPRSIVVTDPDLMRLRALLRAQREASDRDQQHLDDLEEELSRAIVVEAGDLPAGVVTMNAQVLIEDALTGVSSSYTLVFPAEADVAAGKISVLAPLGTALLGYKEGDELEWQMPGGLRRLRIRKVLPAVSPGAPAEARATVASATDRSRVRVANTGE